MSAPYSHSRNNAWLDDGRKVALALFSWFAVMFTLGVIAALWMNR